MYTININVFERRRDKMMKILEKMLGQRKEKEEFAPSEKRINDGLSYSGYYTEKGEWKTTEECTQEYDMGSDDFIPGCGYKQEVSENDLSNWLNIYTWKCEICGMWHAVYEGRIPCLVKKRIKERQKAIENGKIIKFEDYKKKKAR